MYVKNNVAVLHVHVYSYVGTITYTYMYKQVRPSGVLASLGPYLCTYMYMYIYPYHGRISPFQVVLNVRTLMVYHTVSGLFPLLGVGQKAGSEGESAKLLGCVSDRQSVRERETVCSNGPFRKLYHVRCS